jgi:hypothetical protein
MRVDPIIANGSRRLDGRVSFHACQREHRHEARMMMAIEEKIGRPTICAAPKAISPSSIDTPPCSTHVVPRGE